MALPRHQCAALQLDLIMPNFYQRIKKLEQVTRRVHVCTSCGAGERIPRRIIRATRSGPLDRCQRCDGFADEAGWPVGMPCVRVRRGERLFSR